MSVFSSSICARLYDLLVFVASCNRGDHGAGGGGQGVLRNDLRASKSVDACCNDSRQYRDSSMHGSCLMQTEREWN